MGTQADESGADGFRVALDLFAAGVSLMRARLQRENPKESPEEIEARLRAWLVDRPGAPYGDAVGRPVPLGRLDDR